jgi:mevalonate kinase
LKQTYYSNGKLLLTGEYLVLEGALALAIPTKYGQSLTVQSSQEPGIHWKSYDHNSQIWFKTYFEIKSGGLIDSLDRGKETTTLSRILQEAQKLNASFLTEPPGYEVTTELDFPRNWGLGSSSTLINNIAQWAEIDAYILLENSFSGSGYDIAVAQHDLPIFYQVQNKIPIIEEVSLEWPFKDELFFVHLNRKQDSKEGIKKYQQAIVSTNQIKTITDLSKRIVEAQSLSDLSFLLIQHEKIISSIIEIPTIKESHFNDYPHLISSLGAWGGDFILAAGSTRDQDYFRKKGYNTIISFVDMLK